MKTTIIAILALALMVGCSASGPAFLKTEAANESGIIYVYIPKRDSKVHGRIPPTISLGEQKIGILKFNGHFKLVVEPGDYSLYAKVAGEKYRGKLNLHVGAGEIKYAVYGASLSGGGMQVNYSTYMYARSTLTEQSEDEALPIISKTKLLNHGADT